MTTDRGRRHDAEAGDDAPRAARFGVEHGADSETPRGTTPVGHGSVEVTQDHESARELIMGETDEGDTGGRGERA
jgi:hypothetical protein